MHLIGVFAKRVLLTELLNGMANFYLLQTLQVAGVIALAIFIVNVIFSSVAALKKMTGAGRKH